MEPARLDHFRTELQRRRTRLIHRLSSAAESSDLVALLRDVDAALDRIDHSTFGHCEVCRGQVEEGDLDSHPLLTWCLCSLSQLQRQWLQRDLDLATRIQRALLPAPDLRVDGWWIDHRYLPVGPVSGDYCDAMTSTDDGGSLYFLLGDVSGKGVAAALMMARLSALFRSLVPMRPSLPELIDAALADQFAFRAGSPASDDISVMAIRAT